MENKNNKKIFKLSLIDAESLIKDRLLSKYRDLKYRLKKSNYSDSIYIYLYFEEETFIAVRLSDHLQESKYREIKTLLIINRTTKRNVLEFLEASLKSLKYKRRYYLLSKLDKKGT